MTCPSDEEEVPDLPDSLWEHTAFNNKCIWLTLDRMEVQRVHWFDIFCSNIHDFIHRINALALWLRNNPNKQTEFVGLYMTNIFTLDRLP